MSDRSVLWRTLAVIALVSMSFDGAVCLTNVSLHFQPIAVKLGGMVTLFCNYDLEGAPLYSVKWYRGYREFYRYSPSEYPPTKIFAFPGINVDLSMSNESQVVLRNVGFNLSGNFSCEVTADAPSFSSATVSEHLLVVALPQSPPVIYTDRERYFPGDVLRANCTSPPSKPAASLSFLLNNTPVGRPETRLYQLNETLQWSVLPLSVQIRSKDYNNGALSLKCMAYVAPLYYKTAELNLGFKPNDPVPEKVTSPNSAACLSNSWSVFMLIIISIVSR